MCPLIEFNVKDMKNSTLTHLVAVVLVLSACGRFDVPNPFEKQDPPGISPPVVLVEEEESIVLGSGGQNVETFDQTPASEIAAAENVSGGNALGNTVASLGDVTEPGLWLKTPLVKAQTPGRVESEGGASLAVMLIPIEGEISAGSRISLAAMRGLGLGLTDLPTLSVFRVAKTG